MSSTDAFEKFSTITGEDDDVIFAYYYESAKNIILTRAYPYGGEEEVPEKYLQTQLEMAIYLYNKQGAEGEIAHSENGVSRTYEGADVPQALLNRITPVAGVL